MTKIFVPHGFHRALHKHLDSDASSICWNAINVTNSEQWGRFIDSVNQCDEESLEACCRGLYLFGESIMNILAIGLRMLTSEEYKILEEYCMVETDEPKY